MQQAVSENSQLTIIIPFLNEGDEIRNTVLSIKSTATGNPCILLGIGLCSTDYFLLLDGHMRFYESGWDERLIKLLQRHPECILCGQTRKLEKDGSGNVISLEHRTCYGAYIEMGSDGLFKTSWCYTNPQPANNDTCVEIACILGAAYAGSKDFWLRLHGLSGLMYYGGDEELLSTKVWSIGGKCLLVKDWMTGHIYRSSFPYEVQSKELFYKYLNDTARMCHISFEARTWFIYDDLKIQNLSLPYALLDNNLVNNGNPVDYLGILTCEFLAYFDYMAYDKEKRKIFLYNYNSDIVRTKDMKEIYHRIRRAYKEQKNYNTIFKRQQP